MNYYPHESHHYTPPGIAGVVYEPVLTFHRAWPDGTTPYLTEKPGALGSCYRHFPGFWFIHGVRK